MKNSSSIEVTTYQEDDISKTHNQLNEQIDKKAAIQDRINKFLDLYKA